MGKREKDEHFTKDGRQASISILRLLFALLPFHCHLCGTSPTHPSTIALDLPELCSFPGRLHNTQPLCPSPLFRLMQEPARVPSRYVGGALWGPLLYAPGDVKIMLPGVGSERLCLMQPGNRDECSRQKIPGSSSSSPSPAIGSSLRTVSLPLVDADVDQSVSPFNCSVKGSYLIACPAGTSRWPYRSAFTDI